MLVDYIVNNKHHQLNFESGLGLAGLTISEFLIYFRLLKGRITLFPQIISKEPLVPHKKEDLYKNKHKTVTFSTLLNFSHVYFQIQQYPHLCSMLPSFLPSRN